MNKIIKIPFLLIFFVCLSTEYLIDDSYYYTVRNGDNCFNADVADNNNTLKTCIYDET